MSKDVLKVRGFMYKIFPTQEFKNDFKKREFILETRTNGADGKEYKNLTKFGATKSFIAILDGIGIGSEVDVAFALDGREWTSPTGEVVYITSLRAWDIQVVSNTNQERPEPMATTNSTLKGTPAPVDDYDSGDLPFSFILPLVGLASAALSQLIPLLS